MARLEQFQEIDPIRYQAIDITGEVKTGLEREYEQESGTNLNQELGLKEQVVAAVSAGPE